MHIKSTDVWTNGLVIVINCYDESQCNHFYYVLINIIILVILLKLKYYLLFLFLFAYYWKAWLRKAKVDNGAVKIQMINYKLFFLYYPLLILFEWNIFLYQICDMITQNDPEVENFYFLVFWHFLLGYHLSFNLVKTQRRLGNWFSRNSTLSNCKKIKRKKNHLLC